MLKRNLRELEDETPFGLSEDHKSRYDNSVTAEYAVENLKRARVRR